MNLITFNDFLATSHSMTVDFTSEPKDISSASRGFAVQGTFSGATSASAVMFEIQAGTDTELALWDTIAAFNFSSTTGTFLLNVELPCYPYVRLKYTKDNVVSAGTFTVKITGKV
jgi:hypothetical protein